MNQDRPRNLSIGQTLKGLTYLTALFGLAAAIRFVSLPYAAAAALLFCVALRFDYRRRIAVSRAALNSVLVIVIIYSALRVSLSDPVTPILEALAILLAVKLIEEKKPRDYFQVYALATFLLAGSALLSLDIQFLAYLLGLSFLVPFCMVLLTCHAQDQAMVMQPREFRLLLSRSLIIPLLALPMAALLFIILPRTSTPLLGFLSRSAAGVGFSDSVALGEVSSLQESNTVAFRVEMERIEERMLYWRGIVLDRFDGAAWRRAETASAGRTFIPSGKRIAQTIYLEPYENTYLFALDKPLSIRQRSAFMANDLTTTVDQPITSRIRFTAVSVLSDVLPAEPEPTARYLQMPDMNLERIASLSRDLSGAGREETVLNILRFLRSGTFTYSLDELPRSSDPLQEFLFVGRKGNCEYFASAMAVMLRLQGIPARLVGGYRGGSFNEMGGYYLITQNSAHVWVEAYFPDKGWIRLDPTPGGPAGAGRGSYHAIRLFFDTMTYYWNSVVINYDFQKQLSLFSAIGRTLRRPSVDPAFFKEVLPKAVLVIGAATGLILLVLAVVRRRRRPEEALVRAFSARMHRYGHIRMATEGLEEFSEKVADPELRIKAIEIAVKIEEFAYGGRPLSRQDRQALNRRIREL